MMMDTLRERIPDVIIVVFVALLVLTIGSILLLITQYLGRL